MFIEYYIYYYLLKCLCEFVVKFEEIFINSINLILYILIEEK